MNYPWEANKPCGLGGRDGIMEEPLGGQDALTLKVLVTTIDALGHF